MHGRGCKRGIPMRLLQLLLVMAVLGLAGSASGTRVPAEPATPTGCASTEGDPGFDVRIVASPDSGTVPLEVTFSLAIVGGSDSIAGASWDFDGDGLADTSGAQVSHIFVEPGDEEITAQISTLAHGTLSRSVFVSALAPLFDAEVVASHTWGAIPFEIEFSIAMTAGSDSLLGASWDFDGDGLADTSGMSASHVFTEPIDHIVGAEISTLAHGTLSRSIVISGHTALMSLTFDDGQYSVYHRALPLLESKGVTATVYVVPTWIDGGWYMTWANLDSLQSRGWDIGSHSLTHKNLTQVDSATLHYELSQSRAVLQAHGFAAKHFSVPFGACSWAVIDAARLYYESCRGWKGLNPRLENTDPYLLKWDVTAEAWPFSHYQQLMDSVMAYGGWYILNNHLVYDDCSGSPNCVDTAMLAQVIDYALAHRIKILNIEEALASRGSWGMQKKDSSPQEPPACEHLRLMADQVLRPGGEAVLRFTVPSGLSADVSIYDVRGRLVRNLARIDHAEGEQAAVWNGDNRDGVPVASGFYFGVLKAGEAGHVSGKILVIR